MCVSKSVFVDGLILYHNVNAFVSSSAIGKIGRMTDYEIDNYSGTLNNLAIEIKEKYSAILSVLNSAIIEYKEHNGLQ